jgi:DNA-binding NarL/FixJ family response regulator
LKKIEPRAFLNKLRDVARGEASVTQTMATKLIGEFARQAHRAVPPAPVVGLTPREKDVLELVAEGKSNMSLGTASPPSP